MISSQRITQSEKEEMMLTDTWLAKVAAFVVVVAALGGIRSAAANEPQVTPSWPIVHLANIRVADLEDGFWSCDYMATTQGVASADIATCIAVYEVLKERKFNGDLDSLFTWWRQNKSAQHRRLASVGQP